MKTSATYQQTKAIAIFLAMFLCGTFLRAQDITGQWDGKLSVQGMSLKLVLHINKTDDGYTSTMDSPYQGAFGRPIATTTFDGSKLTLAAPNIGMSYEGDFQTDSIVGIFKQGALSVQMILKRGAEEFRPNEKEIVLHAKDCDIYGTLQVPETKDKVPVALMIAGSGPTDRNANGPMINSNAYKMLSDSLNHYGIATLRYDKRGIAKSVSGQREEEMIFTDFVEDAKGWIELLSKDERFSQVIVIGHSEGSLIGMIASKNNPEVSKFISVAGVGVPADEILKEQLSRNLESAPEMKSVVFSYIDEIKQGRMVENVPQNLYALFRPSVQPYMISWFKFNPQEEIKKLNIPILILQGTLDIQVSENEAELLYKANPKAKKVIIQNMDHVLKTSKSTDVNEQMTNSYNNPNTPIHKELVEKIVEFIKL